jgi:hypothetical protein
MGRSPADRGECCEAAEATATTAGIERVARVGDLSTPQLGDRVHICPRRNNLVGGRLMTFAAGLLLGTILGTCLGALILSAFGAAKSDDSARDWRSDTPSL